MISLQPKITNIIKDLELTHDDQTSSDYIESSYETPMQLTQFETTSMDNITEIIMKMATKFCEQDPIPTGLIKDCVTTVAPIIQDIVDTSLSYCTMPVNLKNALLQLLLKKIGLDIILKNYRPVSNLAFLSKIIKKVACEQLTTYIDETGQSEIFQSAYKMPSLHGDGTYLSKI